MLKVSRYRLIKEWRASKAERVRVVLNEVGSMLLVDVRRWFRDADGKLCPGRKGISIKASDTQPLRKALRAAEKEIGRWPTRPGASQ